MERIFPPSADYQDEARDQLKACIAKYAPLIATDMAHVVGNHDVSDVKYVADCLHDCLHDLFADRIAALPEDEEEELRDAEDRAADVWRDDRKHG